MQLLSSGRAVIRQVKAKFGSTLLLFDQSFETLWSIFLYTIEVTPYPSVLLVIDALDECNAESKEILIAKLSSTLRVWHTTSRSNPKKLEVLVTGQPRITTDLKAVSQSHSQYRIGLEDRPQGMIEDVLLFINRKVEELVLHNRCTVSFARSLRKLLNQMAQSCFLWVSLVLEHIKNTVEFYANDLPLLLTSLPDSLQEAYTRYLPSLPQHDYDSAKRYVSLLVASLRPLTVAEVGAFAGLAYSGDAQYPSRRSDIPVIKDRLEMVFGPLVLFVDSCVDFVHPTVKAFLLGLGSEQANELSKSHGTDIASAHLVIATACIRYLLTGEASKDLFTLADPQSTTSDTSNSCKGTPKETDNVSPGESYWIQDVIFLRDKDEIQEDTCKQIKSQYGPFDYAALNWARHYALSEHLAPDELRRQAQVLSDPTSVQCSNWYRYAAQQSYNLPAISQTSPLQVAALFNHTIALKHCLTHYPGMADSEKASGLVLAAAKGHVDSLQILLDHNANPNSLETGVAPLHAGIRGGHRDICSALLDVRETDPNLQGADDRPALMDVIASNEHGILSILLRHTDIQVNLTDFAGRSPFIEAAMHSCVDCVRQLLSKNGCDTRHRDVRGRNALSHAASTGSIEALRILLNTMGDAVHVCDHSGRNALSYAAERGYLPVVKRLINAKLSISTCDAAGRNEISRAANSTAALEDNTDGQCALQCLVQASPKDADIKDHDGWGPLAWAMERPGYLKAVRVLAESGHIDVNQRDETNGRPALSWATSEGFDDIVRYLLQVENVDKNLEDFDGRTACSYAAGQGHLSTVEIICRCWSRLLPT